MAGIELDTIVPWRIVILSGRWKVAIKVGSLDLLELDASGGGSMFRVELPERTRVVPIRLVGNGSELTVRRPTAVAARSYRQHEDQMGNWAM